MTWILLSLVSALFLGLYDIAKKESVRDNAVPAVLLLNVVTGALVWLPLIAISRWYPAQLPEMLQVAPISGKLHALLLFKSMLVGISWTCAFFALKHLPISIATPIRATSPLWTAVIAIAAFGERPSVWQSVGVSVIMIAFFAFSLVGKREGIRFHSDRWVGLMVVATLTGALSALYDKFLLQSLGLSPAIVQAWFTVYLVPVMIPLWGRWLLMERRAKPFQFRPAIPLIAVMLLIADFTYFTAISYPDALISLISPLRRASIVIPFAMGVMAYGEPNWRPKLICILGILVGVYLLVQ
jgi:bacterial/archaeal transporter family protein